MPSLHLMLNFSDPYYVYNAGHCHPLTNCAESWTVGVWNGYHVMDWPPNMQILNVTFKPGGAYPFLQLPLSELRNQIVSLDNLWGSFATEIRERLYPVPTIPAKFALLEQLLLERLGKTSPPTSLESVQYAVARLAESHGTLPIQTLSQEIGISQKHLITRFKRLVGTTPKELARLYRFKEVIYGTNLLQLEDWTTVAAQVGYYDQAHFNKDFEAFSRHNPSEYLRSLRQLHSENPEYAKYPQQVPTG